MHASYFYPCVPNILMVGYMPDEREEKGISRHLEKVKDKFKGDFRGGIAGEYATPSEIGRDESKYFGKEGKQERSARRSPPKVCPVTHKKFEDFATIAPSADELQYFCPYCDALVAREFDDVGKRKIEVYDWGHMPD
jgi:hypothetical protein